MSTIDDQVAAFAAQLEGASVVDLDQVSTDVAGLANALLSAPDHLLAAVAIREWFDSMPHDIAYARQVARGAVAALGAHVALCTPEEMLGDEGLLRRLLRVAYAMTVYTEGH